MCNPILIGVAIGAAIPAIQGKGIKEIALGAAIGGVTAGYGAGGLEQGLTAFSSGTAGATAGIFSSVGGSIFADGALAAIGSGITGGLASSMFSAPEIPGFTPASQQVQQFNSQNIATTGSGGRQATASLADAIKRSKKRKLTQSDVGDLSIDTGSFANTGLQLA